ncbi:hypothetical protein AK830_g1408 [Neonectria ditissima]|uniref:Aflatoxin regulatory protein domain-containing protein n=1 Tax=Neonectria ditissima TaxID=78410 RepID=A0A0P7BZL4_9HYPO|nr:hypothetical protein AK830_g1408 [Neonectria ditissima]
MDSAAGLAPGSLPWTNTATVNSSWWLDSSMHTEQLAMPDQNSDTSWDDSSGEAVGGRALESPGSSTSADVSDVIQTLHRLQQALVQLRRRPRCDGGESNTASPEHHQTSLNPVDAVLRPGQELVDTVRRVLGECAKDRRSDTHRQLTWDRRTLLPLVLTPLSLLLSIYGDMLREVTKTEEPHSAQRRANSSSTPPPPDGDGRTFTMPPSPASASAASSMAPPSSLIPETLDLSLGDMRLDRPLQLIIVTTVIKHHLSRLEHALHDHGEFSLHERGSSFDEFLLSALAGLRTYTRLLLSETCKIVEMPC